MITCYAALPLLLSLTTLAQTTAPATTAPSTTASATTAPSTTGPATTRATTRAVDVSPEAQALLDRLDRWADHKGVTVAGRIVGEFDVAGRARRFEMAISGYADDTGRFVHEASGVGRVVQTSDRIIILDLRRNQYALLTSGPERHRADAVPSAVAEILIDEDPMLLLAITDEPADVLLRGAKRARADKGLLVLENDDETRTIAIDESGAIRSMTIDYTPLMTQRGATGVRQAQATLTYTTVEPSLPQGADFDFKPPAAAMEILLPSELLRDRVRELRRRMPTTQPSSTTQPATRPTTRPGAVKVVPATSD